MLTNWPALPLQVQDGKTFAEAFFDQDEGFVDSVVPDADNQALAQKKSGVRGGSGAFGSTLETLTVGLHPI